MSFSGGEGTGTLPSREITEIEEQVLETVMHIICRELQTAWQALSLEFQFVERQALGQVQQLMPAEERILCLSFEVIMKDFRGNMSLSVPSVISSALLRKLAVTRPRFYTRLGSAGAPDQLRKRLLGCSFRLELGLAVSASSSDLATISPGAVLTFARKAGDHAERFAEGRPVFQAQVARRGNLRAAHIVGAIQDGELEQKQL
jgi:flagellar motor switch protein FliM